MTQSKFKSFCLHVERRYFRGNASNNLRIILFTYGSLFGFIFQPCKTVILNFLQTNMDIIMGIAFGMAVIEVPVYTIKVFSGWQAVCPT